MVKIKKNLTINYFDIALSLVYYKNNSWHNLKFEDKNSWTAVNSDKIQAKLFLENKTDNNIDYSLSFAADFDTQIRLKLELKNEEDLFHLIPANIFGDNNIEKAQPGEYPILTEMKGEFCSTLWEFRADRASHPVSILCSKAGAVGVSVNPYSNDQNNNMIRNGVFSELPNSFGISLGYTNDPLTFINKRHPGKSTYHRCKSSKCSGSIYAYKGNGKQEAHKIIREVYYSFHETPSFKKSYKEAVSGLFDSLISINYSQKFKNYTNLLCRVPENPKLESWRGLVEIGWTGGGIIAFPLLKAYHKLGLSESCFGNVKSPYQLYEEIVNCYNEKSGLLFDITAPWSPKWPDNRVNGWWADFHLATGFHCAYTNGSAAYYLLKAYDYLKNTKNEIKASWLDTILKVLDTIIELQREDGSYGYTYHTDRKEVNDREGFAGCWFCAANAFAYKITNNCKYLESARLGMNFYNKFVQELNCWGTPMDTWKSVDQEGNLAFVRAAALLHKSTDEKIFLDMLKAGVEYDYLWKYCFKANPEFPPLKGSNWNSCGGSITSVSNPHAHPMGLLIADDIQYLAKQTNDPYHKQRAEDTYAFLMNTMELYPEVTGYGQYGVLTERFCPSDGLVIEQFSDGSLSSIWFTFNGWAVANSLEALVEKI